MGAGAGIPLGILSAVQGLQQGRAQERALKGAEGLTQMQMQALKTFFGMAQDYSKPGGGYDQGTKAIEGEIGRVLPGLIQKGVGNAAGAFGRAGGQVGGDTNWNVQAQGVTNRITDPARQLIAQRVAGRPEAVMAPWMSILHAPQGELASTYFNLANARGSDPQGGLGLLASGIRPALQNKGGGGASNPFEHPGSVYDYSGLRR